MSRAPKSYNTSIDLNGNQIHNVVIHNLPTHPGTLENPPKEGQLYFNNSNTPTIGKRLFLWDNSTWVDLTERGDTLPEGLQDVVNINKTADRIELIHRFTPSDKFERSEELGGVIYAASISPSYDGGYYIYGNWKQFGNNGAYNLVKVKFDGAIDTAFNVGTGLNLAPYDNSKIEERNGIIFISGRFTQYNDVAVSGFLSLTATGNINPSFNIGSGFIGFTTNFVISTNNKIYIGGLFSEYNGTSTGNIVALTFTGEIDSFINFGTGFNNTVVDITERSDGSLIITGYFSQYKGVACSNIVKLLSNGTLDTSFVTGSGFNTGLLAVNRSINIEDGDIIVVGDFTSYNSASVGRIVKLTNTGAINTSFLTGTGFDAEVYNISILESGKYLVNGGFTEYDGITTHNTVILNSDGTIFKAFNTEEEFFNLPGDRLIAISDTAECIVEYHGGELILASSFTFDQITGKAEYKTGGLADTIETEILPKRLIRELIEQEMAGPLAEKLPAGTYLGTAGDLKAELDALVISSGSDKNYIFTQGMPQDTWAIFHNLGKYPSITVIDSSGTECEGEVQHIDTNNLIVYFSSSFSGKAILN